MSLSNAPGIVTNGLSFIYDMNNVKSYTGPVVQNLAQSISPLNTTGTGYSFTSGTEVVDIPQLGATTTTTCLIQNNYSAVSTWCCPNPFSYGAAAVSPSTLYTYGIVYKCDSGYTHPNYLYRYEYTANGGTYVLESGIFSTTNRTHLGNGWYWAWATFTTSATTNWITGLASFYYQYSTGTDKFAIAKVFLAQGNYSSLHPRYWPSLSTSRTNTQALFDLTNQNTMTAQSLTYASDGTFSFNGSSSYIDCGNSSYVQQATAITMAAWVYPTSWAGLGNIMSKNGNSGYRFRLDSTAGALWWYVSGNFIQGGACPLNTWSYCTVTGDSTGLKAYVNGTLVASNSTAFAPTSPTSGNLYVGMTGGAEYFQGNISNATMYSRALTDAEVRQNFNALRGRYGV